MSDKHLALRRSQRADGVQDYLDHRVGKARGRTSASASSSPPDPPPSMTCADHMEPLSVSEPKVRLRRIAILWRGDEAARRNATPETSRFKAVFAALADVGVDA